MANVNFTAVTEITILVTCNVHGDELVATLFEQAGNSVECVVDPCEKCLQDKLDEVGFTERS